MEDDVDVWVGSGAVTVTMSGSSAVEYAIWRTLNEIF